ncbi:hypothetical protein BpHYR1_015178 [Brachionus plicatilis]|uniref:Uncharacterized protein n=1 Tax=Brachionus plicatilis TaxID=10195 RepID=A0A3M7QXU0_BRAPC|nr:hypothetical protein BpHYR1_015178 [Brachionus plicatilis]
MKSSGKFSWYIAISSYRTEFMSKPNSAMKPDTHKLDRKTLVDMRILGLVRIRNETKFPIKPMIMIANETNELNRRNLM